MRYNEMVLPMSFGRRRIGEGVILATAKREEREPAFEFVD